MAMLLATTRSAHVQGSPPQLPGRLIAHSQGMVQRESPPNALACSPCTIPGWLPSSIAMHLML